MQQQQPIQFDPAQIARAKKTFLKLMIPLVIVAGLFALSPFTTIPAGHVGVSTLFGKVDQNELGEGFHLINPLKKVQKIDCRNKERTLQGVGVPSQDQLTTAVDVTVKWRVDKARAAEAYKETGNAEALESVHLTPKLRSLIREAGKGIKNAEDFYQDEVQVSMQARILEGLQDLAEKGLLIEEVLLREFTLPRMIVQGVEEKKRQKQLAERQIEELKRFTTEQDQKQVQAKAEKMAAIEEAAKRIALADAQAYEITAQAKAQAEAIRIEGQALQENPEIVKLRAIEKWDGSVPRAILGDQAVPLINLNDLDGNKAP
ncbi:MAG: prohibitin family protein [Verrucomicrobiae bacterium]|nr:prohibitin family protein [Verrucomicrobiae bacterium]NNJ44313.1 prohibitin family protein [Akkermansiaceae bacterium]